jgi:hypothetical protein
LGVGGILNFIKNLIPYNEEINSSPKNVNVEINDGYNKL